MVKGDYDELDDELHSEDFPVEEPEPEPVAPAPASDGPTFERGPEGKLVDTGK